MLLSLVFGLVATFSLYVAFAEDNIQRRAIPMPGPWDAVAGGGASDPSGGASAVAATGGVNYKIWGDDTCPDSASLIYEGIMGKAHYTHGGGVNYLCLPRNPDEPEGKQAGHQTGAYVYGVEYQTNTGPFFNSLFNKDAPCAVCEAEGRSQTLMVPGKNTCYEGWTLEYHGLLASQHSGHKGSEFVCLASSAKAASDSNAADQNGGLLYINEVQCSSLKCPPYTAGIELTCAVCTK